MAYSAIKIRLYPNQEQEELLRKNCGCCRFVWNHFLGRKIADYRDYGENLNFAGMCDELTYLKYYYPWLKNANAQSLQQTLKDLDQAFQNFFRRVKNGEKPGFPKFKKKFIAKESFRVPQHIILNVTRRLLILPKLDPINFRCDIERFKLITKINSVTVLLDAGKFYASCLVEVADFKPVNHPLVACGIDVGVVRPLTIVYQNRKKEVKTSVFGRTFSQELEKKEKRRKHYQRVVSRKKKGSNNQRKAQRRVARSYQRERFYRQNWIEQTSNKIANTFAVIKFEDLKLRNMTKSAKGTVQNPGKNVAAKSGLNRELLRLGLGNLVVRTEQKSLVNGGQVIYINPRFTSQTCSRCGVIDKNSRQSQSEFHCTSCGKKLNADKNAALNILRA